MTTKISPDDLLEALSSLKPEADDITNAWYIGRREQTLQQVLARATQEPQSAAAATVVVPTWRHRRRAILASVAAVALLTGGAAWAYSNYAAWYTGGGLTDLTCMTSWGEPGAAGRADEQYGGLPLTTDPVADCHKYADLTGKPRIVDPVAVHYHDWLVVGPRAGMPADAVPITQPVDAGVFELESSLADYVDGGMGRCFDETTGTQFARSELDRLGLTEWTITVREQDLPSGECAMLFVPEPGVVEVRTLSGTGPAPASSGLIPLLRSQIAERCLSLADAEAVVTDALASTHHWATSTQLDPAAACTRVDLVIGGSMQVFLYGPETASRTSPTTPTVSPSVEPTATATGKPAPSTPMGPISVLLQTREEQRREIHDATELKIADCMAERGFRYTPGENPDWEGLTQRQIDQWNRAFFGEEIQPEDVMGPGPITDPTILVAKGPDGATFYFRSDSCTTIGRAAIYGDLVEWTTVQQAIDHLANQASEKSSGDKQRRAEIETELADANRATIDQFTRLQNAAITTARTMLASR